MLTIIEVLEGGGLPQLVVAIATKAVQHRVLGELLAESVKVSMARIDAKDCKKRACYLF